MRLRERFARFMYGRYGPDRLYNALFCLEIILLFVGTVLNLLGNAVPLLAVLSMVFFLLGLATMIYAIFRFFSRNLHKRRKENEAWLRFWAKCKGKRTAAPSLPADTPTHVFRSCPGCGSTLRLPRVSGKHRVKCPRCGESFGVKVK